MAFGVFIATLSKHGSDTGVPEAHILNHNLRDGHGHVNLPMERTSQLILISFLFFFL